MNSLKALALIGAAVLGLVATGAHAQNPVHVRGTITSLHGDMLGVKTREGKDVEIKLAEDVAVNGMTAIGMADIKPGSYIGTAAMQRADGQLVALEVLVFPEAARGTSEGHFPWDLQPESTMTNATVAAAVDRNDGKSLTLTYKGEQKTVLVPSGVPVVTFSRADRSLLAPGAQVFIIARAAPDGTLSAPRVTVGRDGLRPPM